MHGSPHNTAESRGREVGPLRVFETVFQHLVKHSVATCASFLQRSVTAEVGEHRAEHKLIASRMFKREFNVRHANGEETSLETALLGLDHNLKALKQLFVARLGNCREQTFLRREVPIRRSGRNASLPS